MVDRGGVGLGCGGGSGFLLWLFGWCFLLRFLLLLFFFRLVIIIKYRHFGLDIGLNIDLGGFDLILLQSYTSENLLHLLIRNNLLSCTIPQNLPIPLLQLLLIIFLMVSLSKFVYFSSANTLPIEIW